MEKVVGREQVRRDVFGEDDHGQDALEPVWADVPDQVDDNPDDFDFDFPDPHWGDYRVQ